MMCLDSPNLEVTILLDRSRRNLKVYIRNDSAQPVTVLDYPGRLMLVGSDRMKQRGVVICLPSSARKQSKATLLPGGNLFFTHSLQNFSMRRKANSKVFARLDINYEVPEATIGKRLFQSKQFSLNIHRR
jgi:hypothetical protein